jgi:hypothetical protein
MVSPAERAWQRNVLDWQIVLSSVPLQVTEMAGEDAEVHCSKQQPEISEAPGVAKTAPPISLQEQPRNAELKRRIDFTWRREIAPPELSEVVFKMMQSAKVKDAAVGIDRVVR